MQRNNQYRFGDYAIQTYVKSPSIFFSTGFSANVYYKNKIIHNGLILSTEEQCLAMAKEEIRKHKERLKALEELTK
jgi:hypothetical protein